jgi:lipopolysaccharide/colanic/teichoic acid biosynthesis glycosyltransferase
MCSSDAAQLPLTVAGDRRITYTGAILRKFKLDELPQFVNVLRGEMSFIGPRPEMPEYVQYQDALWRSVLEVRPGITDAATLVFRDEEQLLQSVADADSYYRATLLPAKLRIALRYRESRSLPRDLTLLWLTARYSIFPRNFDRERVLRALGAEAP